MTFIPIKAKVPTTKVVDVASNTQTNYFLDTQGLIWGVGTGQYAGDGQSVTSSSYHVTLNPVKWSRLVSSGSNTGCALDESSYAWCWGNNLTTVYGIAGTGSIGFGSYLAPVPVMPRIQWVSLSGGYSSHFVGLNSSSYAWAWGNNVNGNLGNNTATGSGSPVSVVGGRQFRQLVICYDSVIALDSSSYAWSWGSNATYGTLGDGTVTNRSSPVSVLGGNRFNNIQGNPNSRHVLALDSSSNVWAWGNNDYGQLGDNTITHKSSPISIIGNMRQIWNLGNISAAMDFSSNIFFWGINPHGDGSLISRSLPTMVKHSFNISDMKGIYNNGIAYVDTDSNLLYTGSVATAVGICNSKGVNNNATISIPTRPSTFIQKRHTITQPANIKTMGIHTAGGYFVDTSSRLWAWGLAGTSFGIGVAGDDIAAGTISSPLIIATNVKSAKMIFTPTGNQYSCGYLDYSSNIYLWGTNTYGRIPDQKMQNAYSRPQMLQYGKKWLDLAIGLNHTLAIDQSSFVWAWGYNSFGQLGDNTIINKSSPVSVVGGRKAIAVFAGAQTSGFLDTSSYLWMFGYNQGYGCLGDNTVIDKSSPVSVVGARQFRDVRLGYQNSYALDSASYVWGWGINNVGYIGDNTVVNRSSPVSIVGNRRFISLADICYLEGISGFGALDASSVAWVWGVNNSGQLGDNTLISRSSPVSVYTGHYSSTPLSWDTIGFGVNFYGAKEGMYAATGSQNAFRLLCMAPVGGVIASFPFFNSYRMVTLLSPSIIPSNNILGR